MKKTLLTLGLIALGSSVHAEIPERFKHTEPGEFYFGGKVQRLDIDNADSDATTLGATLGINLLARDYGVFALDTYFSRTIDAAEINAAENDVNLAGVYLAYRSPTKMYAKAKVGTAFTELETSSRISDDDVNEFNFSWGVGGGIEIYYGVDLELEYAHVSDEISAISLNLIFND